MKNELSYLTKLQIKELAEFIQTVKALSSMKEKMAEDTDKIMNKLDTMYVQFNTILKPEYTILTNAQREELIQQHDLFEKASVDCSAKAIYVDKLNEFDSFSTAQLNLMEKEKDKKKREELFAPLIPLHKELKELSAAAQVSMENWIKQFELLKKNISKYYN